jgi:hypothetical protein
VELGAKNFLAAACALLWIGCSGGTEGWILAENAGVGTGGSAGSGPPPIDAGSDVVFEAGVDPPGSGSRNPENFAEVCSPQVFLQNRASEQDERLFRDAFPDLWGTVVRTAKHVCSLLYKRPNEVPRTDRLTVVLQDFQGAAGTIQDSGSQTTIFLNTAEMRRLASYGDDVRVQFSAVLYALLAIDYQLHDENPDQSLWLIEGLAEWARHEGGYGMSNRRRRGGNWYDGRTTTGWFLDWLDEQYSDAIYLLNQSMHPNDGIRWSEHVFEDITGEPVGALWNRYQASL